MSEGVLLVILVRTFKVNISDSELSFQVFNDKIMSMSLAAETENFSPPESLLLGCLLLVCSLFFFNTFVSRHLCCLSVTFCLIRTFNHAHDS